MVSHACGNCGKPLDASARSYVAALRMWVASCPRCGLAVRWNLRRARDPYWVWARTRSINIRLGIALAAGQLAGLLSCPYAAIVGEDAAEFARLPSGGGSDPKGLLAFILVLGGAIAAFASISAVLMAPHRGIVVRLLCAWILGALPVPLFLLCIGLSLQWREVAPLFHQIQRDIGIPLYLGFLAVPVLLSVILVALLGPLHAYGRRVVLRQHARRQVERLRGLHRTWQAPSPSPSTMNP